jgi:hypothetical protein
LTVFHMLPVACRIDKLTFPTYIEREFDVGGFLW